MKNGFQYFSYYFSSGILDRVVPPKSAGNLLPITFTYLSGKIEKYSYASALCISQVIVSTDLTAHVASFSLFNVKFDLNFKIFLVFGVLPFF